MSLYFCKSNFFQLEVFMNNDLDLCLNKAVERIMGVCIITSIICLITSVIFLKYQGVLLITSVWSFVFMSLVIKYYHEEKKDIKISFIRGLYMLFLSALIAPVIILLIAVIAGVATILFSNINFLIFCLLIILILKWREKKSLKKNVLV